MLKIPKDSLVNLKSPNKLLIFSFLTIIIGNCITIFGLSNLDLKLKLIICLSVVSFVLLIDVIVLYTEYYKFYYQAKYLNKIYSIIDNNLDESTQKLKDLETENIELRNDIISNAEDIAKLKSKFL